MLRPDGRRAEELDLGARERDHPLRLVRDDDSVVARLVSNHEPRVALVHGLPRAPEGAADSRPAPAVPQRALDLERLELVEAAAELGDRLEGRLRITDVGRAACELHGVNHR